MDAQISPESPAIDWEAIFNYGEENDMQIDDDFFDNVMPWCVKSCSFKKIESQTP